MNLKKHQANIDFLKELSDYGFHIEHPRKAKPRKAGDLISFQDEPCELLELIEICDYKELWSVRFFDESQPTFILL